MSQNFVVFMQISLKLCKHEYQIHFITNSFVPNSDFCRIKFIKGGCSSQIRIFVIPKFLPVPNSGVFCTKVGSFLSQIES